MGWYNGLWPSRKKLTIPAANVTSGPHTDFPVPVITTDADILADSQTTGWDLVFTASDGTTQLKHERVYIEPVLTRTGSMTWYSQPYAVYSATADKTFFGYVDQTTRAIMAREYNHATQAVTAGTALATHGTVYDDHWAPAVHVRTDGKVLYAYCDGAHTTPTFGNIKIRVSSAAGDTSAFDAAVTVGALDATYCWVYTRLVKFGTTLYLWSRRVTIATTARVEGYFSSADDGDTWSAFTPVLDGTSISAATSHRYTKMAKNGSDRLDFVISGHPNIHSTAQNKIVHLYMVPSTGNLYQSDGTLIGNTYTYDPFTVGTLVYDCNATGDQVLSYDVAIGGDGYPRLLYDIINGGADTDHNVGYARWTGAAWSLGDVATQGNKISTVAPDAAYYGGGMCFDPDNVDVVWYGKEKVTNGWEIYKATRTNDTTWTGVQQTDSGLRKNFRPTPVKDAASPLRVLWIGASEYAGYQSYTAELWCAPRVPITTSRIVCNVKIPSLVSTAANDIYCYYGHASATDQSDAANTWDSSYKWVYHGRGANHLATSPRDSIAARTGTKSAATTPSEIVGNFGRAQSFTAHNIDFGAFLALQGVTGLTVEAWGYFTAGGAASYPFHANWNITQATYLFSLNSATTIPQMFAIQEADTQKGGALTSLGAAPTNAWHFYAGRFDRVTGNLIDGFIDKTKSTESGGAYALTANIDATAATSVLLVGSQPATPTQLWKGYLEEMRVSAAVRSDGWLATQYDAYADPATFWTVGSEEAMPSMGFGNILGVWTA